ncbi:hypothetical protein [Acetobacterium malicum]|uniref:hypothetical protein n=1 Tax=Acetobacterium malicum TaxID=52692 RepID=UPI0003FF6EF5|nr:hypothetical protein [Acetobacterium dehalogenans]
MKIYFSDFFEVEPEKLKNYEAFNISLLNDLPLFIDPFLIFCSEKLEYKELHNSIIDYLFFLRDEALKNQELTQGMMDLWYKFPEVKQTYLGFCKNGNSGRGLGEDFAIALHSGLNSIFRNFGNEEITKSTHVEKLCLIKPKVGRDSISDFVTNLIKGYLLTFTEEFTKKNIQDKYCMEFNVAKAFFNYEKKVWQPKKYYLPMHNNHFVLLTPCDLLVRVDTWINKNDMYKNIQNIAVSIEDEALRFAVNDYFISLLSEKPQKQDKLIAAQKTIEKYPSLIDYYIRDKEEQEALALENSLEEVSEVNKVFIEQVVELANFLKDKTGFYDVQPNSFDEAMERVNFLKHVIEDCDGYRWFYDGDKPIRREADLHIMYKLVCYDTIADFNSEVNNGRGPVDFKASNNRKDTTLIEFKLSRTLKKNLEKQVNVYKDANNTDKAIKVILYFTDEEYKKTINILNELELSGKPGIVLIDARADKIQASKAK